MSTRSTTQRTVLTSGLLAGLILTVTSCASATIVPLEGRLTDVSALTGEWAGTYTSPDINREGTIWFKLVEGEDHAHGEVRMTPKGSVMPYGREIQTVQPHEPVQFLAIRFVRVSATDVSGTLDQYWDPDAGCFANTVFRGRLQGDRIEGHFETRLCMDVHAQGRWSASRKSVR